MSRNARNYKFRYFILEKTICHFHITSCDRIIGVCVKIRARGHFVMSICHKQNASHQRWFLDSIQDVIRMHMAYYSFPPFQKKKKKRNGLKLYIGLIKLRFILCKVYWQEIKL